MSIGTVPYTSIDRIFAKIQRDYDLDFAEGDVIEWTAEALEAIGAVKQYEEAVCFIEVKNHQIQLPKGLHAIIQIARNNCYIPTEKVTGLCPKDVVNSISPGTDDNPIADPGPNCPIVIDCNGQPLQEYDLAYYRPYFDLKWLHGEWCDSYLYTGCFKPVRLTDHTFFNSIVCQETESNVIYQNAKDEYTIIAGEYVRFNFKEGQVAISYLRQVVDEQTGYPLIPDHYSYTTAITSYIIYKMMGRNYYNNRQGSDNRLQKAEQDWHWYCRQAGNLAMMPKGVDEYQNLLDQRNYLIPQLNRYYGFFGNLNKPEGRRFNNPDYTNRVGFRYFRGM